MKIAVLAANGQAGQEIVKEAVKRGHEVTAIVRSANKSQAQAVIEKDILDVTRADLQGFDAVVTAFGVFAEELLPLHTKTLEHLVSVLENTDIPFYVVGGAGSLYLTEVGGLTLAESDGFPEAFRPLALAMKAGLDFLRASQHVDWVYLSPAADFDAEAPTKGTYVLEGEVFTTDAEGKSQISYADYAKAMVDLIEDGSYAQTRLSVRW
ncbi:NAD(P)H-binding protein [Streptococcus danieliae]|nr:NAD(P)H-binding protein [Streptococcus danieliae]